MLQINRLTPKMASVLPPKSKKAPAILREAIYLDTETSHNYNEKDDTGCGWVYQWAFTFCGEFAWGRRPSELLDALDRVAAVNHLGEDLRCIIYIHNASYDLTYLLPWLVQRYGEPEKMIARAAHKILMMEIGPWIIRCSYLLANRSLAKWGKDLGIPHKKKKGMIDYNVRRYQDTKLTRRDWIYMLYDCQALRECCEKQMEIYGDNLNKIPLTSTGYVRRDARIKSLKAHARKDFLRTRMDAHVYSMNRFAFSGGLVHGNRHVVGQTVECEAGKDDFRSHYPTQLVFFSGYPVGPWVQLFTYEPGLSISWDRIDEEAKENCLLITAIVRGLELKPGETLPYAQISKFLLGATESFVIDVEDNGRIIKAHGASVVTFTEIDWEILRRQYVFPEEPQIIDVVESERGPAPEYLIETVNEYYKGKSDFKDLVKELEKAGAPDAEVQDAKISLMTSKNSLNACYGMCGTDPVRMEYTLDFNTWEWDHERLDAEIIQEKLDAFYSSRNNFMKYSVGVYCTALARRQLMDMYDLIGHENFLYCDTDSMFFRWSPEIEERIRRYNELRETEAIAKGSFIESNGKKITYCAFEDDRGKRKDGTPKHITAFRFLHAKAYAYISDGELHCTIAGVAERDAKGYTREQELGSIDRLEDGTTFTRCGGTRCVYLAGDARIETIEGHRTELGGAAVILPTVKTLHDEMNKDIDDYMETELTKREVREG